ncbi:MAG: hypothetical protein ACOYI3_01070 [Christensenellales bacterium]
MKKLALIRRVLVVSLVLLVGLVGFGIGRISAPEKNPNQQEILPERTPLPQEAGALPEETPHAATPSPSSAHTPTPAPTVSGEARPVTAGIYVLKRDGSSLVVLKNEVVVAAFSAEWTQLPDQVKTQLETGIMFESLDDIESYLEDYES